jgi:hypothetical protein
LLNHAGCSLNHGECSLNDQVATLAAHNFFGERSLLKDDPTMADVVATTDVQGVCLDRRAFDVMLGPLKVQLRPSAPSTPRSSAYTFFESTPYGQELPPSGLESPPYGHALAPSGPQSSAPLLL